MSDKDLGGLIFFGAIIAALVVLERYVTWRSKKRTPSVARPDIGGDRIETLKVLDHSDQGNASSPAERSKNTFIALLAAIGAFAAALALEAAILGIASEISGSRLMPRGPGWLVLPAMAGVWAWRRIRADAHMRAAGSLRLRLATLSREERFKLVLSSLWAGLLCIFWLVAKPYRYTYGPEHALLFLLWLILPPLAALGALKTLRWASQGNP